MTELLFNSQTAIDSAREWANSHSYKVLSITPLKDKCVLEFIDEENVVKYIAFNESGKDNNVVYGTFKECALAALLDLRVNDDKILNMLMTL
jgi:hypothetical protein